MALNFDKIISENENVSLEDLPIESLVQSDLDNCSTFNKLFEDHLAILINQNGNKNKLSPEILDKSDLFDLDLDGIDIEDNIDKNLQIITEPLPHCYINLIDFVYDNSQTETYPDSDEIFSLNGSECSGTNKKSAKVIRRQSTRIQNQIRKKIAEQIQKENIRLAKEAQRLNSPDYASKTGAVNSEEASSVTNPNIDRYLSLPTDLDADDDSSGARGNEDDPNKLWCICKQPYGFRFMICCDNCSEWYHGDCVGVTQEQGARMESNGQDFICPVCEKLPSKADRKPSEAVVISDDDDDDNELLLNPDVDEDCQITRTTKPMSATANIFQILKSSNKPDIASAKKQSRDLTLSVRTSVCLTTGCKTLVNPHRSLYCSKKCIDKYSRTVKKNNQKEKVAQYGLMKGMKLAKMTRFVLAQIETDTVQDEYDVRTEENLKEFLMKNPTYRVFQNEKSKPDILKRKKVAELLPTDATRRIKTVRDFALIFKELVPKTVQIEFLSIWQQCMHLEEALFALCDNALDDKYLTKAKDLLDIVKLKSETRLALDFLQDRLLVSELLGMSKEQIDMKWQTVTSTESQDFKTTIRNGVHKKSFKPNKTGGISMLLADTTHLHGQHLYDINCQVCNGASKTNAEKKQRQEKELEKEKERVKMLEMQSELEKKKPASSDADNIIPPTITSTPESIVASWFSKSTELGKVSCPSPHNQNDEFKVTSTVETPDMVIDMELCSTPTSEPAWTGTGANSRSKVDSSKSKQHHVTAPSRHKLSSVWEGEIYYKEVGSVACKTFLISRHHLGTSKDEVAKDRSVLTVGKQLREEINLAANLSSYVKINGRTKLLVVQDYLRKLRKHSNKEFLVFRLHPDNLEEGRDVYLKMFNFFHSKDRCGVIDQKKLGLKDCFIYPLNAHAKIPQFLLPLNGPGFEKRRPHMLLMLVVRTPIEYKPYKSFSPKYDQDHDFVKNHGINLDKYCQPPVNPSTCPSPIIGAVPDQIPVEYDPGLEAGHFEDGAPTHENERKSSLDNEVCSGKSDRCSAPSPDPSLSECDYAAPAVVNGPVSTDVMTGPRSEQFDSGSKSPPTQPVSGSVDRACVQDFDHIFNPAKLDDNVIPFLSYPARSQSDSRPPSRQTYSGDLDFRVLANETLPTGPAESSQSPPPPPIWHTATLRDNNVTMPTVAAGAGAAAAVTMSPLPTIAHISAPYCHSSSRRSSIRSYSNSDCGNVVSNHIWNRFVTVYDAYFDDEDRDSKRARYFFNPRYPSAGGGGGGAVAMDDHGDDDDNYGGD